MRITLRILALALALAASLTSLTKRTDSQGQARPQTISLDWVELTGEVTYSDGLGCSCSASGSGGCSVQYDRHGRNIGSCDDTDTLCGDVTRCPH
jgi:hypothetical protein